MTHATSTPTRPYAPALAAALFAFALFAITLRGTYIYDDQLVAQQDPRLHDPAGWRTYLTTGYFQDSVDRLYRPFTSLTYWLQWQLHGDRPWAMHLVNILLHAAVSAGVAELGRRLAGTRVGLIAGLLFAAHPVHVEAVAGITGRAELLCTGACVAAVLLVISGRMTRWRAIGIALCTVLAVGSKEQGILLPAILGAAWIAKLRPAPTDDSERKTLRWLTISVCWGLAAYLVIRELSPLKFSWDPGHLDWSIQPLTRSRGLDRWLLPFTILGRYTALLIAPIRLSLDYGYNVIGFIQRPSDPYLYLGLAAAIAWITGALGAWRRRAFIVAWCLIAAAIVYMMISNIPALIGTTMGERLMYLPSVFLLILLAFAIAKLPRTPQIILLVIVLALASLRTVTYARQWNDRLALDQRQADENPNSVNLQFLLAYEQMNRGDARSARVYLQRAREIAPDYWLTWVASARAAVMLHDFDTAENYLNTAWHLKIIVPTAIIKARQDLAESRRAYSTQPTTKASPE
jgi:hypothetical protein